MSKLTLSEVAGIGFWVFVGWMILSSVFGGESRSNVVTIDCNDYSGKAKESCWNKMDDWHYEATYGSQAPDNNYPYAN